MTARGRKFSAGYKILVQEMPRAISRGQIDQWIASKSCPPPIQTDDVQRSQLGRRQMCLTFELPEHAVAAKRALSGSDLESGARLTRTRYWKSDVGA